MSYFFKYFSSQQSSEGSRHILIETEPDPDHSNTRHTTNVVFVLKMDAVLYEEFDLTMSNDRNLTTKKYKTTSDAVFTRNINRFKSKLFISHFSCHRPIVSVLEFDENADNDDVRVVEIMDEN
ncbi:uncharacterized protein LOC135168135 [Diachasmimorpha longicaudata]|uniref:uncharacterized protein LOC135168135 n=1 Tax=Diachasmimorpha longicaudata TaxID=58733 RepID=UPI0030B8BB8C